MSGPAGLEQNTRDLTYRTQDTLGHGQLVLRPYQRALGVQVVAATGSTPEDGFSGSEGCRWDNIGGSRGRSGGRNELVLTDGTMEESQAE